MRMHTSYFSPLSILCPCWTAHPGLGPERELHGPGPKSGTAALGALNAGSGGLFPTGEAGATNGDSSAVPALPAAVLEAEEGAGAGHRGGRMPLASPGTPGAASGESTLTADLAELMRNPVYMRNIYGMQCYFSGVRLPLGLAGISATDQRPLIPVPLRPLQLATDLSSRCHSDMVLYSPV